ncbi:hypothetical protein DESC_810092 [Desulfosarcina cetonica]|nr:hypothetical protein DESC_810092 [Desulfosarcina cetonica]
MTTDRIRIQYGNGENPIDALHRAIQRYGRENAFILVPTSLWRRLSNNQPKRGKDERKRI